ncbi:hypothetical protein KIN20_008107 [Parelaphostrongylus tenuis]|uniref:Uncharacterized protein n=1 Tax=Parelaphostrongylus tenuis TaxID=148309 RepID=A0AAD5QH96_PARTN|nr:hypothetical protein KIN20_008107 [Parelaphostrongylus tenuis]
MGGDESPPLLDRECAQSADEPFTVLPQNMCVKEKGGTRTPHESNGAFPEAKPSLLKLPATGRSSISTTTSSTPCSGHPTTRLLVSNGTPNDSTDTKYSMVTLGGALGMRKQRSLTNANQSSMNNDLTLDQLNPTLAEALAAVKSKNGAVSKSGSNNSLSFSDGCASRRDTLPTRMSGPVTLEALAPSNAIAADGSVPGSGHLVSFNGQTTEVPEEIHCHLCDYPMKLCIRKSKYKGEIREYAAYRCLRKGCQTFRSVRKVIEPELSLPRKRKFDDASLEIFDACSALSRSEPVPLRKCQPDVTVNNRPGSEGFVQFPPLCVSCFL